MDGSQGSEEQRTLPVHPHHTATLGVTPQKSDSKGFSLFWDQVLSVGLPMTRRIAWLAGPQESRQRGWVRRSSPNVPCPEAGLDKLVLDAVARELLPGEPRLPWVGVGLTRIVPLYHIPELSEG